MSVFAVKSTLFIHARSLVTQGAFLAGVVVFASGCGKGKGNDIELGTGEGTSSTTQNATVTTGTQTGNLTTTSAPKDATQNTETTTPGITTSFDTGLLTSLDLGTTSASGTGADPNDRRDCAKIKWGKRLKEGGIVSRGDVSGYMDADGDGLVEEKLRDVGMCQMHLSGKRCGLMVYGRWG